MNISALLSVLKVIDEAMKFLNDIEVHTYIYYHYTYNINTQLIYYMMIICWYSWLSCILSPSRLAIGLCSVHTIDAAVDASPVNEYIVA